jgi:hypothetical protein
MSGNGKRHAAARTNAVPKSFLDVAGDWCRDQSALLLEFVWFGYDELKMDSSRVNTRDLERSVTQLLEARVRRAMSGFEPFYVQHGSYERETMKPPPAQPPQYDLAFVLNADERVMWPLEAKVLEKSTDVSDYVDEVRQQFLACRYAPFCGEGGMIGYLLSGTTVEAFERIEKKVPCKLEHHARFPSRPHKTSSHSRQVPAGKSYQAEFLCHHLIFEFFGLQRHTA